MSTVEDDAAFEALLRHIKEQRGFDFTGYKRASLVRRVRRRMDAIGVTGYEEYEDHLTVHPDEFTHLFNTILINVTGFFRDTDAWDHLRDEILPAILRRREGRPIRVWSAGCASGQEAYTAAILLAELLGPEDFRERVKIYATDVDEEALAQARQASYADNEIASVPEALREKYFTRTGTRYVFRKELRRSVIFGRNDLVQDAPISHVDLLMCRNTMMYLNAQTQAQVLQRMHFALAPDGVLFLGKAEMLLSHSAYFRPIETRRRFFGKVDTGVRERGLVTVPTRATSPAALDPDAVLQRSALLSSAAAQVVLDAGGRLVMSNHRALHLFGLSSRDVGRPIQDLEISYRPLELRSHMDEAVHQRRTVWVRDVELHRLGNEPLILDVQVVPLSDDDGGHLGLTVIFNDVTQYRQLEKELQVTNLQLETAYEELQSTNEELETTNEELQSTVEELETTNEELQSTNEELETMNEELQAMNDELQVSNETLRDRQEEVDRLNRFMSAVLGSMNAGVAVVDADLQVLAWNSRAEDLWGVRADEAVGQHLLNLDIGLPLEDLRQPLRTRLAEPDDGVSTVVVDAVNRRGRSVRLRTTLTSVRDTSGSMPVAMLVMDVLDEQPAAHLG
ncbi:CheR family methyltransferase [Nocardioides abyssi]|uniref:protein-glutamate O-methyltransferase n=1 Tax=Nocardioides abyssi TaxID=3058370 RepID=A0ABT8EYF8_9ACTN|nr:CheR family methyltransferase [Nocardioides abyssi]MDN4162891.1 CheR family methyltransferase [Nocardioides abyssi]